MATRAVNEELGLKGEMKALDLGQEVEQKMSRSYPGLQSKYTVHIFEVPLSVEQFNKEEQADKTTFFEWELVKTPEELAADKAKTSASASI